jgi:hypothetical protein
MMRRLVAAGALLAAWQLASGLPLPGAAGSPEAPALLAPAPVPCESACRERPPRWYYMWINFRKWMTT